MTERTKGIVLLDLLSYDESHTSVNMFWAKTLSQTFEVKFIAEEIHAKFIATKVPALITRTFKRNRFWKIYRELLFTYLVFKIAGKQPLIIMGATGAQHLVLSIFELVLPKRASRILVIFHSELEGLDGASGVQKKLCKFAINILGYPRQIVPVVLGAHVKKSLVDKKVKGDFHVIEHPLPTKSFVSQIPKMDTDFEVSLIGLIRGDTKDLSLPRAISRYTNLNVRYIGRKGPKYTEDFRITTSLTSSHYQDEWMRKQLETTHGLLVCPKVSCYKFTASGAATDSIHFGKYLIYLRHDALNRYQSAPFTISGETVQELTEKIRSAGLVSDSAVNKWVELQNKESRGKFLALVTKL